jgi:hypothetical protein
MRHCLAWLSACASLAAGCGRSSATKSDLRVHLDAPVELELLIDTGATGTSLPSPAIVAVGLEEAGTYAAHGLSGCQEGRTYRLENLNFQGRSVGVEIQDCALPFGLLGMDILSQSRRL